MARTNSPIGDPEPVYELPDPVEITDPVEDDKVAFRKDKKYSHVLDYIESRQEALRGELLMMPGEMSYAEKGMKAETNMKIIQELENFKTEIELSYGLRKQQGQ